MIVSASWVLCISIQTQKEQVDFNINENRKLQRYSDGDSNLEEHEHEHDWPPTVATLLLQEQLYLHRIFFYNRDPGKYAYHMLIKFCYILVTSL